MLPTIIYYRIVNTDTLTKHNCNFVIGSGGANLTTLLVCLICNHASSFVT